MNSVRSTKQKKLVLDYLNKHQNEHLTIQQIEDELQGQIGVTTIYRIVNNLIKKGIVSKIPLNNKQGFCYQYNPKSENCSTHYHLICEKCGQLSHFSSEKFKATEKEALEKEKFSIDSSKVVFFGECENCKKRRVK